MIAEGSSKLASVPSGGAGAAPAAGGMLSGTQMSWTPTNIFLAAAGGAAPAAAAEEKKEEKEEEESDEDMGFGLFD